VERWLRMVLGEIELIREEFGSLAAMAAKKKGWDEAATQNLVLPMLESLQETIAEFRKEIEHARK
jgi:hypothetical protein